MEQKEGREKPSPLKYRLFPRAMAWDVFRENDQETDGRRYENRSTFPSYHDTRPHTETVQIDNSHTRRHKNKSESRLSQYDRNDREHYSPRQHERVTSYVNSNSYDSRLRISERFDQREHQFHHSGSQHSTHHLFEKARGRRSSSPVTRTQHPTSRHEEMDVRGGASHYQHHQHNHHMREYEPRNHHFSRLPSIYWEEPGRIYMDESRVEPVSSIPQPQHNGRKRGRASESASNSSTTSKRCSYQNCDKISVSRGLCRGHGGGRRCQFPACNKSAQSRSNFCWGHGGGQRCEAPNCKRSRKTKRFCVAHVHMENTVPFSSEEDGKQAGNRPSESEPSTTATVDQGRSHLPSLTDLLKTTHYSKEISRISSPSLSRRDDDDEE